MGHGSGTPLTTLRDLYPERFAAREALVLAAGEYLGNAFRGRPLDLSEATGDSRGIRVTAADLGDRTIRYSFREGASTLLPDLSVLGQLLNSAIRDRLSGDAGAPVTASATREHPIEVVKASNARDIALPDGTSALSFDFQATLYLVGPGSVGVRNSGGTDRDDVRVRGTGTLVGNECLLVPESMTVLA